MMIVLSRRTVCAMILGILVTGSVIAAGPVFHELQKGETLYGVAKKYGIPYEALAAANSIVDPTRLRIGQRLVIPGIYRVVAGDTLSGIAARSGVALDTLRSMNRLTTRSVIQPGDMLVVPASIHGTSSAASGPSTTTTSIPPKPVLPSSAGTTALPPGPVTTAPSRPTLPTSTSSTTVAASTTTTVRVKPPDPPATVPSGSPVPGLRTDVQTRPDTTLPDSNGSPVLSFRMVDRSLPWPAQGEFRYLAGKLEGILIRTAAGETARAVAHGTVVSAGPSRGFGDVVFVQSKSGHVYVYGGNERLLVVIGQTVEAGQAVGRVGVDRTEGIPVAYFFVFKNGVSLDPALAPRD